MKPATVETEIRKDLSLSLAGIEAVLAGSGVGVLAFSLGLLLLPTPALIVDEPLASELVLRGISKISDFIVPVAAAVLGALVALAFLRAHHRRAFLTPRPESKAAGVWLTVALAVVGSGVVSGLSSLAPLASATRWLEFTATPPALGVAVVVFGLMVAAATRSGLLARVAPLWWLCLIAAWLTVAAVVEIVIGSLAAGVVGVLALLWAAAVLQSGRERWAAAVHARLLPVAIALPFLLGAQRSTSRQWLAVGLAVGVAGAVAFFDRAWAGPVDNERLSPLAVGSMSVLAISSFNPVAHPLSGTDLFHAGEQLVQFQLVSEGLLPYLDFVPYPGTIPLAVSALGAAVFGGPIVGFVPAYHVMAAGVAFVVATLIANRAGSLAPALPWACMVLAMSNVDRVWPAAILLVAVTSRPARTRSWIWPLGWFAGGVTTVALVPSLGAPAVLATIPYGLTASFTSLHRLWRDRDVWRAAVLSIGVAAVAVVAMPIVAMLVTEAAGNTLAWGLTRRAAGIPQWIFLTFGAAGTIVTVVVAVVAVRMDRPRSLAVPLALFSLAAVPYMWGRIGPGLSRSGRVSIVLLVVFLPVVINEAWPRADVTLRAVALAPVMLVAGVLLPFSLPAVADGLVARPELEPTPAVEGSALQGLADELQQDLLTQRDALRLAAGDGTAWDMASRLTLWPLADVLPASRFASSIYAATLSQQQEVLRDFEARPPAAILIAPRDTPIPISPALRSYLPYRWLMQQRYEPVVIDDNHFFLLSPERFSEAKRSEDSERLQEATYADLAALTAQADLQSLPASWADLSGLGPVPTQELSNGDGRVVASTDEPADVLVVTAQCPPTAPGSYRTSTNATTVTEFEAASGRMVLPLGHDPTWLMADGERRVELVTGCEISEVFFARI